METLDLNYPVFKANCLKGEKIIEVLETLGGINVKRWQGNATWGYYGVRKNNRIIDHIGGGGECYLEDRNRAIDIEEFLKL